MYYKIVNKKKGNKKWVIKSGDEKFFHNFMRREQKKKLIYIFIYEDRDNYIFFLRNFNMWKKYGGVAKSKLFSTVFI